MTWVLLRGARSSDISARPALPSPGNQPAGWGTKGLAGIWEGEGVVEALGYHEITAEKIQM